MTDRPDHNIITINLLVELLRRRAIEEFWNVVADDDFTGELIPGSRRVPVDRIGRESARLPKDTVLGFKNVRVFEGGLAAWKASGRGVETLLRLVAVP